MAAWSDLGAVPAAVEAVRASARVDVARIGEIEERTHHDVIAFTEAVAEQVGEEARWFHYGLTSSDVVDTALALQLRDGGRRCCSPASTARRRGGRGAARASTATRRCIGRTHGVHAEPTTFGLKLLGWVVELRRNRERLARASTGVARRQALRRGRHLRQRRPARRGARAARRSASAPRPSPPRSSRATGTPSCCAALALLGSVARAVRDRDPPPAAHRGARGGGAVRGAARRARSAMPHKRNPIAVRAHLRPGARAARQRRRRLRERGALARARHLALLGRARHPARLDDALRLHARPLRAGVIEGLVVYPERMLRNLDAAHGLTSRAACCSRWSRRA